MKGNMWIALAVALLTAVPGGVLASHLVAGNPETVVTGHTVLTSNIFADEDDNSNPTDFAAAAGLARARRENVANECVVWFNGIVIFDGTPTEPCGERANDTAALTVFAVEAGDCDPREATSAVFVRDLSYTDPNGQVHKVSEIQYTCFFAGLLGALVPGSVPGDVPDSPPSSDGDPLLSDGQNPATFGLLNETFTEFVWVTSTHADIVDPTLAAPPPVSDPPSATYNFALIIDTCARACTDGGPEPRFDDTARGVTFHEACPASGDEIADGNSNGNKTSPNCADDHREDKRNPNGNTDYDPEEDHLTAEADLFASSENCLAPVSPVVVAFCLAPSAPQIVTHNGCLGGSGGTECRNGGDEPDDVGRAGPSTLTEP